MKVLSCDHVSIRYKVGDFRNIGLKETVIIGKIIPAGTGLSIYRDFEDNMDETISSEAEYVDLSALVSKTNAL